MFECLICGKTFKSKSGLSGHQQFAHPREVPDNERLALNLETTLDEIGQLREEFSERLGGIERSLEGVRELQRGFSGTLKHQAIKPTSMILDHWQNCEDCQAELVLLRAKLAGLVPALPPTPPVEPKLFEKEPKWPWEQPAETTNDPAVAAQWEREGEKVREIAAAPPPPAAAEKETQYPWED
jgi:hypothetical protein